MKEIADGTIAYPLITIANIIWSFSPLTHLPRILLVKRAYPPFEGHWALPETLLWRGESADAACTHLIRDKVGVRLSNSATEQSATFTDPGRVSRGRASAIAHMAFLPTIPQLGARYGTTEVGWLNLNFDHGKFILQNGDLALSLAAGPALAFDHHQIINTAIVRVKNRLDYQPTILQILGPTFVLRQTCEVYTTFRRTTVDQIDNSSFKKTRQKLFKEIGTAAARRSGQPPKLFKLVLPCV